MRVSLRRHKRRKSVKRKGGVRSRVRKAKGSRVRVAGTSRLLRLRRAKRGRVRGKLRSRRKSVRRRRSNVVTLTVRSQVKIPRAGTLVAGTTYETFPNTGATAVAGIYITQPEVLNADLASTFTCDYQFNFTRLLQQQAQSFGAYRWLKIVRGVMSIKRLDFRKDLMSIVTQSSGLPLAAFAAAATYSQPDLIIHSVMMPLDETTPSEWSGEAGVKRIQCMKHRITRLRPGRTVRFRFAPSVYPMMTDHLAHRIGKLFPISDVTREVDYAWHGRSRSLGWRSSRELINEPIFYAHDPNDPYTHGLGGQMRPIISRTLVMYLEYPGLVPQAFDLPSLSGTFRQEIFPQASVYIQRSETLTVRCKGRVPLYNGDVVGAIRQISDWNINLANGERHMEKVQRAFIRVDPDCVTGLATNPTWPVGSVSGFIDVHQAPFLPPTTPDPVFPVA